MMEPTQYEWHRALTQMEDSILDLRSAAMILDLMGYEAEAATIEGARRLVRDEYLDLCEYKEANHG